MKELSIELTGAPGFRCGDEIRGTVSWVFTKRPKAVFIRLFWRTSGKGSRDMGIDQEFCYEMPELTGTREFSFISPTAPYSFSGRLISILWAIEAGTTGKEEPALIEIEISPTGKEILLENQGSQ